MQLCRGSQAKEVLVVRKGGLPLADNGFHLAELNVTKVLGGIDCCFEILLELCLSQGELWILVECRHLVDKSKEVLEEFILGSLPGVIKSEVLQCRSSVPFFNLSSYGSGAILSQHVQDPSSI